MTKGASRKMLRIMGRGRTGFGYKRYTHVTIKVEKVDFQKEIDNAKNPIMLKKWKKLSDIVNKIKLSQPAQYASTSFLVPTRGVAKG